ncbi:MAG: hypothetical protein R3E58_15845 [Phycisphaerae bacterium]
MRRRWIVARTHAGSFFDPLDNGELQAPHVEIERRDDDPLAATGQRLAHVGQTVVVEMPFVDHHDFGRVANGVEDFFGAGDRHRVAAVAVVGHDLGFAVAIVLVVLEDNDVVQPVRS